MSPKLVDVEEKKQEIIEATITALSEKELSELKIADIAEEAGMGQSTIYEYFANKDQLIKQAFEYFLKKLYVPQKNEGLTTLEEFELVLEKVKKQFSENQTKEINILIDLFYQGIKGEFPQLKEMYEGYLNYLTEKIIQDQEQGLIREDIDPQVFVSWVGAAFDGISLQLLLKTDNCDIEKVCDSLLTAIEIYSRKE